MPYIAPYFSTGEVITLAVFLAITLFAILVLTIHDSHAPALPDLAPMTNGIMHTAIHDATTAYGERIAMGYTTRNARAHIRAMVYNKYAFNGDIQRLVIDEAIRAHHKAS